MNYLNEVLNKIINSKLAWIILGFVLLILSICLIFFNGKNNSSDIPQKPNVDINNPSNNPSDLPNNEDINQEEKLYFSLKGDEVIDLYVDEEYIEPGFIAQDKSLKDISSFVSIVGSVNNKVSGTYQITYILKYKDKTITLTRNINVLNRNYNEAVLKLNGSTTIYIPINGSYKELGATAFINDYDITKEIIVTSNLNVGNTGEYTVTYQIVRDNFNKKIVRKVIVFDHNTFFTINNLSYTNQDVLININIDSRVRDNFNYVILPDKTVKTEKNFNYKVSKNGTYQFILYDKEGNLYKKQITINNIDKTVPTGSCQATIYNDSVSVLVNALDNLGIFSYQYMIDTKMSNPINANNYKVTNINEAKNVSVQVTDRVGNKTTLTCQIKDERDPVFIDGNRCSDSYIYKGEKYSLTKKQKEKLAAMIKAEFGGNLLGMKAVASHMANLYEHRKWRGSTTKSFYNYITTTTWYAERTRNATSFNSSALKAVEDCIVNGNRILPLYIDEFDYFPYDIPDKTSIANVYGSKGTFWCLTIYESGKGNIYFYTDLKYREYISNKYK